MRSGFKILLLGPPGSGKTTLLSMLTNPERLGHLSKNKVVPQRDASSSDVRSATFTFKRRQERNKAKEITFHFVDTESNTTPESIVTFDAAMIVYDFSSTQDIQYVFGSMLKQALQRNTNAGTGKRTPIFLVAHKFDIDFPSILCDDDAYEEEARQRHQTCTAFRRYQKARRRRDDPYVLTSIYQPETLSVLMTVLARKLLHDKDLAIDSSTFLGNETGFGQKIKECKRFWAPIQTPIPLASALEWTPWEPDDYELFNYEAKKVNLVGASGKYISKQVDGKSSTGHVTTPFARVNGLPTTKRHDGIVGHVGTFYIEHRV